MEASLRELNVHASALARRAQAGERVTITDRGRPIAELGPHRAGFRFALKADVRKLKKLGVTLSLEVGYELSPRGHAYLDALTAR